MEETDAALVLLLLVDLSDVTLSLSSPLLRVDLVLLLVSCGGRSTDFVRERVLIVSGGGLMVLDFLKDLLGVPVSLIECNSVLLECIFASSGSGLPKKFNINVI